MARTAVIESDDNTKSKGRSFPFDVLGEVFAPNILGQTVNRPVALVAVASQGAAPAVMANLMLGNAYSFDTRRASSGRSLMRSRRYIRSTRKVGDGVVLEVFDDVLFRLSPVAPPQDGRCDFVCMPTRAWLDAARESQGDHDAVVSATHAWMKSADMDPWIAPLHTVRDHMDYIVDVAPLYCAYLDRRIYTPLIRDPKFQARLLTAAILTCAVHLADDRYDPYGGLPTFHNTNLWFGTPIVHATSIEAAERMAAQLATEFVTKG